MHLATLSSPNEKRTATNYDVEPGDVTIAVISPVACFSLCPINCPYPKNLYASRSRAFLPLSSPIMSERFNVIERCLVKYCNFDILASLIGDAARFLFPLAFNNYNVERAKQTSRNCLVCYTLSATCRT